MSGLWQQAEILEEIAGALAPSGWAMVDEEDLIFQRSAKRSIDHQLGLGITLRDRGVSFLPSLGVKHRETSDVMLVLLGLPKDPIGVSSYGCSLLSLLPGQGSLERWHIDESTPPQAVTNRIVRDIGDYGERFFSTLPDAASLVVKLKASRRDQMSAAHLAVMANLIGLRGEALDALAEYARSIPDADSASSAQSWRFVRAYLGHFQVDVKELPFSISE
ncbi:hypothetical protein ACIQ62_14630 [Streptomyces sp. NPDC096319]|uniref:hypothetical protein n=1 Tax=Streptomyces sp. NPDC096319 TaxID=3366084 RepID=UPI0038122157